MTPIWLLIAIGLNGSEKIEARFGIDADCTYWAERMRVSQPRLSWHCVQTWGEE